MIVCTDHNVDVEVEDTSLHGTSILRTGWCHEDGGHEVEVWEY